MKLSKSAAGLIVLLFVLLLAGTVSALPGDDRIIRDPPSVQAGERVPVFLVLNEQQKQPASFAELKADALGRQAQVLETVRAVDSAAARTARSYWIANAVWLEADPATLDKLAAIPGVSHIEPDLTVTLSDPVAEVSSTISPDKISQPESGYATVWSVDYIEAPSVWKNGTTGEGVKIAIVDTGIDGEHPAFGDRVVAFADFVNGDNSTAYDDYGHGTHCAGTAAGGTVTVDNYGDEYDVALGVAPGANLIGAKVLNDAGSGQFSTILSGAQWAIDSGADVVSMSLGGHPSRGNSTSDFSLLENESRIVSLEVSSEMYGDPGYLYEPQFVIGSVRVEEPHYEAYAADAYFADPLENLTITLTDANGNTAGGAEIDWLGFDQGTNRYYFKAPYASNTAGWNGVWKLNVTNTGETEVWIQKAGLSEYYQSNGETILDATVNTMVAGGTVVVISAGNSGDFGTATIGTPGTAEDAITVGATDYLMDYRAYFSSMGPVNRVVPYIKPDVMAPGVSVISAYPGGQYASMQGTSMACPAVAGTAALMLSGNETLTPADVKAALMETAVHIGEDGAILPVMQKNNAYGAGRINAYEAVNATGGLDGVEPWDGIRHELIGGTLASYYVTGNTLPVMAVLWNTTAGEPIAGAEVELSTWYDYYANNQYQYIYIENRTLITDANGYAYHDVDITDVPVGEDVYARFTYGSLQLEDYAYKNAVTPTPTPNPTVPIYESVYYSVPHNATVEIKYPLLAADGSAYAETVNFVVRNSSGVRIVDEPLVPVDGVISCSLDLAGQPLDETYYYMRINDRSAGNVYVGEEGYMYQEVIPFPERAICPPGESVDLGVMAFPHHGGKTVSQEFDVYVTTLTETEVLSLS
ncbi:S8 family serine peptidase, partial [Methanoculleus sp.]|uniref:S8 family peptidase n=1 Tax=Methanoculleus sp. TaxID=90427 RepID=UPI0025DBDF62